MREPILPLWLVQFFTIGFLQDLRSCRLPLHAEGWVCQKQVKLFLRQAVFCQSITFVDIFCCFAQHQHLRTADGISLGVAVLAEKPYRSLPVSKLVHFPFEHRQHTPSAAATVVNAQNLALLFEFVRILADHQVNAQLYYFTRRIMITGLSIGFVSTDDFFKNIAHRQRISGFRMKINLRKSFYHRE